MNNIRIAMKLRGRKEAASELVERLGVTPEQVSTWEQGENVPAADIAEKIAAVLDVDEAWIRGTAQSVPLYDPLEKVTFTCPIVRSEKLPDDTGMLYHVYLAETGDVVALLLFYGLQFTVTDWTDWWAQPKTVSDIPDCKWMDARGADAIMLNGMPHMFPV